MDDINENIKKYLNDIIEKNILTEDDLKIRILNCIKKLSENEVLHILDNFMSTNLDDIENKENFMYELFLDHVEEEKGEDNFIVYLADNIKDASNKDKIMELLKRTRYTLTLSSGQRRYGGPPPLWEGPEPGSSDPKRCTQVHIGKLGKTIFEDVLVPLAETYGRIYQLRIMVDQYTGYNKGYAFVDFFTKEEAEKFIEKCHKKVLASNEPPITVKYSIPNCRLFLAGLPSYKSKEEVENEIKNVIDNIKAVFAFPSNSNSKRNRGFAFIDFKTHNDANQVRKKLQQGKLLIFNQIYKDVEWAETPEHSDEVVNKLKTLHVRFNPIETENEQLKQIFKEYGNILNIDKLKEYAFVEYDTEEAASAAIAATNDKVINNIKLIVSYAKSSKNAQIKKRKYKSSRRERSYEELPRNRKMPRRPDRYHDRDVSYPPYGYGQYEDPYYNNWNRPHPYGHPPPAHGAPMNYDMYGRPPYNMYPPINPRYPRPQLPPQYNRPQQPIPPHSQGSGNIRAQNWSHHDLSLTDPFLSTTAYPPQSPYVAQNTLPNSNVASAPQRPDITSNTVRPPTSQIPPYSNQYPRANYWQ